MKKFRVALVTAMVLLVSMLCLAACGATGTYKFDHMEVKMGAITTTVKAGDEFEGKKFDADSTTLTLKSGGKAVVKSDGTEKEGTWEEKDGKINVTIDGATIGFEKDGSYLIWTEGEEGFSMKTYLKK